MPNNRRGFRVQGSGIQGLGFRWRSTKDVFAEAWLCHFSETHEGSRCCGQKAWSLLEYLYTLMLLVVGRKSGSTVYTGYARILCPYSLLKPSK